MQNAKKSYISFKTRSQINLFKRTRIIDNAHHAQNNANYSKNYSFYVLMKLAMKFFLEFFDYSWYNNNYECIQFY